MALGKKHSPEQIVNVLRQIEVAIANRKTTQLVCKDAGITGQTNLFIRRARMHRSEKHKSDPSYKRNKLHVAIVWSCLFKCPCFHDREPRKSMRFALPSLLLLVFMVTAASGQNPSSATGFINGVYAYNGSSSDMATALSKPYVDGAVYYIPWYLVEPNDGDFEWGTVDRDIATVTGIKDPVTGQSYNKKIAIAITPGWAAPAWLFTDAGAQSFTFLWDQNHPATDSQGNTITNCTPVKIPIPWDPVYLAKWTALIQAFGARYGTDPRVSHIEASGISSKTMETFLPWQSSESISGPKGVCTVGDSGTVPSYVTQWQQAGYTPTKIHDAWSQIAATYSQAFPNKMWGPVIPGGDFPPIDNDGTVVTTFPNPEFQVPQDILNVGVDNYSPQFVGQNNGLSCQGVKCFISSQIAALSGQVVTGYQTASVQGCNLQAAVNQMLQDNGTNSGRFLEVYVKDINDTTTQCPENSPNASAAATYAHQMLTIPFKLSSTHLTYPGATNATVCISPDTPATATGNVQIFDGTTLLTTQSLQGDGCAYWYISPGLSAGMHSLTAVYAGDANNPSNTSATVTATVDPVPVNISASCWNASFAYGANYQCTVNLSSNAGAPSGSITYSYDNGAATTLPLSGGNAQFTVTEPVAGTHKVMVGYTQQGNYAAATAQAETFTVTPAPVNISLTPSSWYTSAGTSLTFQAAISSWSAGPPNANGAVSFYDGTTLLATIPVNSIGQARYTTASLIAGAHIITAAYEPEVNYASGASSVSVTLAP